VQAIEVFEPALKNLYAAILVIVAENIHPEERYDSSCNSFLQSKPHLKQQELS
jgi:hypothetical protein